MTDWPKIRLLERRLAWHRGKAHYRRRALEGWIISGKRAHHWKDHAAILRARAEIRKWQGLLGPEELEIHRLEVALDALRPKHQYQEWQMGGWVRPGEPCWKQRDDQGNDFEIPLYHSVVAPARGRCTEWASDRPFPDGFGTPYAIVEIFEGPFHDAPVAQGVAPEWYLGHANEPIIRPGESFSAEQPLARLNHSLNEGRGWIELGHWTPGSLDEGARWHNLFGPVWR